MEGFKAMVQTSLVHARLVVTLALCDIADFVQYAHSSNMSKLLSLGLAGDHICMYLNLRTH